MNEQQKSIIRAKKAIEEIKAGKMVILVDDEDRENEGDLTMAAELVTPDAITFMATKGCGLICLTLTPDRVEELDLPMMVASNQTPLGTAFTVSIEAAQGVTTGISAADRSQTIQVAIDPKCDSSTIISPGHIFPLRAMPGGVLQRTGQTEGSVDLARLAGLNPSGVICEIMKQDGTMARMDDLKIFAKEFDMVIVSIADLIEYRLQHDRLIEKKASFDIELGSDQKAMFKIHIYKAAPGIKREEYIALTLGTIDGNDPVPVRGHVASIADDVFGANTRTNSPQIKDVIDAIIKRGRGVILFLPSRESIFDELNLVLSDNSNKNAIRDNKEGVIREYGIGAQILIDLGVKNIKVISNNPHRLVGLEAWGFDETKQISIEEV